MSDKAESTPPTTTPSFPSTHIPPFPRGGPGIGAGRVVLADAPCRRCSYNLRSLSLDGLCPECGTPVGLSVQGDLLRYSDPKWLDTVRMGITLFLFGGLLSIAGVVASRTLREL